METAKGTDLPDLLEHLGYQVRRVGRYHTTREMDSLRIKDRRTWKRYSNGTGGDAITFLQEFCGKDFREAVNYLLEFNGHRARDSPVPQRRPAQPEEKPAFILPIPNQDQRRVFAYLQKRGMKICIDERTYFLPLEDLIDQYMPNYKKALEECPDLLNMTTFPDGHIYSLGKKMPARPKTSSQPIINKTWLDNLGLSVPTTLDELENVLRAFKEQDANGNGDPNDEIPICGINLYMLLPFGYDAIDSDMMLKNGEVYYAKTSEEYKEGIKWMQKMYAEGLIDSESFTQDETMRIAKYQSPDDAKVGFAIAWIPDAEFGQWSDQYIAIAPVTGPDGQKHAYGDENGISALGRNEVVITKDCKYPEVVARWLDQFYTDEASIQNFWGAIGTVIDKDADGNYTLLDPPEGTSADAWYWEQSLRDFGPKYVSDGLESKLHLSTESGDGLKLELAKLGDDYIGTPFPAVMYTTEEIEEVATIETDTSKYIDEMMALWITDNSHDIDAEWDSYIQQLKAMNFDRLVEIKTNAYNRYIGK